MFGRINSRLKGFIKGKSDDGEGSIEDAAARGPRKGTKQCKYPTPAQDLDDKSAKLKAIQSAKTFETIRCRDISILSPSYFFWE